MAEAVAPISNPSILSNPAALQQWSTLLDSVMGTSTTTTGGTSSQGSSDADPLLMQLIQQMMGAQGGGANQANIMALLAPIFAQFRDGALPGIQGMANAGGGVYNSTTQGLLQNDALARAVAQGGGVVVQQQNNAQTQIANLLKILAESTKRNNTQQSSNASKSGNAGSMGKAALGGAAAAAAAKAAKAAFANRQSGGRSSTGNWEEEAGRDTPSFEGSEARQDDAFGIFEGGGEGTSGGMEEDSWDSGNTAETSFWDSVDFTQEDWAFTPDLFGGEEDSEGYGDFGIFEGGSSGNDGYYDDPGSEDLGEYF